jgi:hypothetical protein
LDMICEKSVKFDIEKGLGFRNFKFLKFEAILPFHFYLFRTLLFRDKQKGNEIS